MQKQKFLNFEANIPDLGVSDSNFVKLSPYFKSVLSNLIQKTKILKCVPKMPDLGILSLEFENNVVIFEINTIEMFLLYNIVQE